MMLKWLLGDTDPSYCGEEYWVELARNRAKNQENKFARDLETSRDEWNIARTKQEQMDRIEEKLDKLLSR